MAATTTDGVLPELQRELNEFMATHASVLRAAASALSIRGEIASNGHLEAPLSRLRWMATSIAQSRCCKTVRFLLLWLAAVEENALSKGASWLVAYLVGEILADLKLQSTQPREPTPPTMAADSAEKMVDHILDRCVVVFQETFQSDAARAVDSGGGFFTFKPVVSQLRTATPESTLQNSVAVAWRHVLALVSLASLNPLRLWLQKQLLQNLLEAKAPPTSKEYLLLKNLSDVRLGLGVTTFLWPTTTPQTVKDAALLLKTLLPLTLKPHKPPTRLAAISAIASMLNQELDTLDAAGLQRLYGSFHAVGEWNTCITELHSTALKLCGKRDFTIAAWELRVAVLSLAPNEIFSRYWKEDLHALLRVQYQQNKDGGGSGPHAGVVLECVARCFTHVLKRHFLSDRRIPSELECMETINTTQAWCFFAYPKTRSFEKLRDQLVPVLVQISIGIAAYNMLYSIHSHLRRLVLEADHIFDEKKLVGLEALVVLCEQTLGDSIAVDISLPLDQNVLLANRITLGELVGQTLIEANALFGGELLIESTTAQAAGSGAGVGSPNIAISTASKLLRDDYRRSVALVSYACALKSLKYLYAALELSDDQKILILTRSCIHKEPLVRDSASAALHHIIQHLSRQAGAIFRGITDYIFRLSNHLTTPRDFDAFLVLIELLASLLRQITAHDPRDTRELALPWENPKAKQESLLQIESAAVYLLVFEDPRLLGAAVQALQVVDQVRSDTFGGTSGAMAPTVERPSVIDVLRKADWELRDLLFYFESPAVIEALATTDLGFFHQLITDLSGHGRASFRWSSCLSIVFAQLAIWSPEVAAFMWSDVHDKVTKLEPVMPSLLENDSPGSSFDLARWRNLAILATSTACPHLLLRSPQNEEDNESERDAEESRASSVQSVISSSAVQTLFKRLGRYLKSAAIEQRKATILALGSTHVSSLPILTEVLQKYESEAFTPLEQPVNSRHSSLADIQPPIGLIVNGGGNGSGAGGRRMTKEQKARNLKAVAQLHLQWALGRCYRLLLQSTQQRPLLLDETTREAVQRLQLAAMGVVTKIATALLNLQQHHLPGHNAPHHIVFMMQQDFCSSVRLLAVLLRDTQSPCGSVRNKQRHAASRRRTSSISSKRYTRCSSVASLSGSVRSETVQSCKDPSACVFDLKQREAWYALLLSWCPSFSSLANARLSSNLSGTFFTLDSPARDHWMQRCDVLGERCEDAVLPWQWMDEGDVTRALGIQEAAMASFQRFFLCQTAFATVAVVVHGPRFIPTPITQDAMVFRWLDECFAVDVGSTDRNRRTTHHFEILQRFCHQVVRALLQSDFQTFADICVDKSFFSVSSGDKHNIAKHYFRALTAVVGELQSTIQEATIVKSSSPGDGQDVASPSLRPGSRSHSLQVRVCHAILMHLGIENDPEQRERAAFLINHLFCDDPTLSDEFAALSFRLATNVSSAKRSNATFGAQVMNRMQVAGASFLVQKLAPLAYQMSLSMLKFLSCCEPAQQKKTLVVVLPWLAEVSLETQRNASRQSSLTALDADQLLSLLFRITTNLGASCCDQLEQAWLTLAFAEPVRTDVADGDLGIHRQSNLSKILQFLFLQRTTTVRLSTAKMAVWWLCRWQSAAHEVMREALLLVETRRRESAEHPLGIGASGSELASAMSTIQPVDDVFVFVILLSDSCCHLANIPSYLYQQPAMRESMVIQAVHFAFLALFALALDPTAFAVRRTVASASGGAMEDHHHQSMYVDAWNDCIVLLRQLIGQLYTPVELLEPILEELAAAAQTWQERELGSSEAGLKNPSRDRECILQLEQSMASFASCLPPSSRNLWAFECVKEVTLALVPGSTLLKQTSSRCNNTQVLYCVRFGLLGYRVLAPEFHGDVLLTLLDLLHHALEEHTRDPVNASAVLGETLHALRSIVACMPPEKLVLYPQLLWVCVALLNHGKSEVLAFQKEIMDLLVEILRMPHFATNALLHDVLLCKKPQQWTDTQASVLRTMVWNLDRGSVKIQQRILPIVAAFVVLPSPVFHADAVEHVIICSMVLLPYILAACVETKMESPGIQSNKDGQGEHDEDANDHPPPTDPAQQATDLRFAWLAIGSDTVCDVFRTIQRILSQQDKGSEHDSTLYQETPRQFAAAFVPQLVEQAGERASSLVTLCFEILIKVLGAEDVMKRACKGSATDTVVTATLWVVEALMTELGQQKLAWRPTSALLGSLARLVRQPEQTQTWQAAVRIMGLLGPSSRSASGSCVLGSSTSKPSIQLTISTTPPSSESRTSHSFDSPARSSSSGRGVSGAPGTPSKRDGPLSGARKFVNLMGQRSSPSRQQQQQQPSNNQTTTGRANGGGQKETSCVRDPSGERAPSPLASRRDL